MATAIKWIKDRRQSSAPTALLLVTIASIIIPLSILYYLYPNSFEATWKGRTYYLFFIWLVALEAILGWEELQNKKTGKLRSLRTLALIIAAVLPTAYVLGANFCGLNTAIVNFGGNYGIREMWAGLMPLAVEYLVLAVLFAALVSIQYGISGLGSFSVSTLFVGAIGLIYVIDNLYPFGKFAPLQIIVPTTAGLAANVLNLMGYQAIYLGSPQNMPTYIVRDSLNNYSGAFSIAWPCSGVESLIIYTITILLFMKKSTISRIARISYFVIGAVITYFINVLRIATIFIISINGGNVTQFHDYYGQLYSISWIISYPLIIIGFQALLGRLDLGRYIHFHRKLSTIR